MTPSYVDKYFGKVPDAVSVDGSSSFMSGNENFTVIVYLGDVVVAQTSATGVYTVANTAAGAVASTVRVVCSVTVSEPLLGLPTCEMKEMKVITFPLII